MSKKALSDDIIAEILSWLPVVSILRFKSVCKTWRRIIEQDDELMEKHHHRAGAATCFSYQYKHIIRRLGYVFVTRFETEKKAEFWCIDTQKGLVLEKDRGRIEVGERLRIRNPATRQAVYLPVVPGNWTVAGIFFVGKSCCKVICFSQAGNSVMEGRFRAITVGVDATWRPLNNNKSSSSLNYSIGIPSFCRPRRRIYWMGINYRCPKIYALSIGNVFHVVLMDSEPKKILSVDSKTERCKSVEIPETLFSDWSNVMPREWDSKLCLYGQDGENNINIWVLQNDEEWAKTSIVVDYPVPFIAEDAKVYIQMPGTNCWLFRGRFLKRFLINLKEVVYDNDDDNDDDDNGDDDDDDDDNNDDDDDEDEDEDQDDGDGDGDDGDDGEDGDDGDDDDDDEDDDDEDDDEDDNDDAVVVIKPTILQLKGMKAMPQEAIDDWKEEEFVGLIPSQIISLLSVVLDT